MTMHAKIDNAWKTINTMYIKLSGVWHTCKNVYVKVNGVWKPCVWVTQTTTTTTTTTQSAKASGPGWGKTVTLSNVKTGTTVTISGKFSSNWTDSYSDSGASSVGGGFGGFSASNKPGRGQFSYSGASLISGSTKVGPSTQNYTIKLKATSTTVKVSVKKIDGGKYITGLTCSISYTKTVKKTTTTTTTVPA